MKYMRKTRLAICGAMLMGMGGGCVVHEYAPAPEPVVVERPIVTGPGVEVIEVEPAPVERVYIYEPGYPPGTYYCDGYYWYGGYRYERDVFVERVVVVNVRERRYVDVEENRRIGGRVEIRHREEFARYGGMPRSHAMNRPAYARPARPAPGNRRGEYR